MIFSDLYINGKWVEGAGRHPVYDPSDGSVIAEIAIAGTRTKLAKRKVSIVKSTTKSEPYEAPTTPIAIATPPK